MGATPRLKNRGFRPRFFSALAAALLLGGTLGPARAGGTSIAETLIHRARERMERGEYAAALAGLDAGLASRPGDVSARMLRAEIYARQNRWDLAGDDLREILKSDPGNAPAECGLGEIAYRQNRLAEAYDHYQNARQLRPSDSFAGYMMFLCQLLQEQTEEAGYLLERMESGRKDPAWHFAQAAWAYHQGDATRGDYLVGAAGRMWNASDTARYARPLADRGWVVGDP